MIAREELEFGVVKKSTKDQQLKLFGYLLRMRNERPAEEVWKTRVQQKTNKRETMRNMEHKVSKILQRKGKTWSTAGRIMVYKLSRKGILHYFKQSELNIIDFCYQIL